MPDNQEHPPENNESEDIDELFLIRLRYKEGRLVKRGGNEPFLLDDPQTAWVVFTGKVDVFAVRLQDGEPVGARTYLGQVESGQALFGMDLGHSNKEFGLLAVGLGETGLIQIKQNRLRELAQNPDLAEPIAALLYHWIQCLSMGIVSDIPPKLYEPLSPDQELSLAENTIAFPQKGLIWIKHLTGDSQFISRSDLTPISPDGFWPISSPAWLLTTNQSQ